MSDNIENIDENEVAPEVQKVDQSKLMKEKNVDAVSKKQVAMKVLVQIGLYAFLTIMALIVLFPFYWMLMSSVKTINEYNAVVPTLWPHQFRWETYKVAFERVDFGRVFLNTCFVGIVSSRRAFHYYQLHYRSKLVQLGQYVYCANRSLPRKRFLYLSFKTELYADT